MKLINQSFYLFIMLFKCFFIHSDELTISSYNCGGLTEHYDYLRAVCMQKLMQERYTAEPENMSLNEKIQKLALKIQFSPDSIEKEFAQLEWDQKGYQQHFEHLTAAPTDIDSPNAIWNKKSNEIISSYQVRPIVIQDQQVNQILDEHLTDLAKIKDGRRSGLLQETRRIMAKRIFEHFLNYDVICLQEADYLESSLFPQKYEVLFTESSHSKNGIAWNKERFELIETLGNILGRAMAVQLRDRESGKTILVASGHFTGCNPYFTAKDAKTGLLDSAKGDHEIQTVIDLFESHIADIKIIGMDSNVTSLHPRLNILKNAGYQLDYENYLEPTCTNPHQVLNTRIDWIAIKSKNESSITNIPVLSIGLNSIQTNMSDHKPIAAKIKY